MNIILQLYINMNRFTPLYYANNCNATQYILSPFFASLITGAIYSIGIKEHISRDNLYIKRQNEEIIERLKRIEKELPKQH
jgi:hypothetical protein